MKTTVDIADGLLREARAVALRRGTTLRSLIEEGLEHVVRPVRSDAPPFRLRDASVGGTSNGRWESATPDERLEILYGDRP